MVSEPEFVTQIARPSKTMPAGAFPRGKCPRLYRRDQCALRCCALVCDPKVRAIEASGNFTRGYAVTSYGSQDKTVDHVLFADSSVRAATNAEQWYVTISRGRKSVRIFTADKARLAANIDRVGHRELALALDKAPTRTRGLQHHVLLGLRRADASLHVACARSSAVAPGCLPLVSRGRFHRPYEKPIEHHRIEHAYRTRLLAA